MLSFNDLTDYHKIRYSKQEFSRLVKQIFENPEILKVFVSEKILTNKQAKEIINTIHLMNSKSCVCCRRFDPTKLCINPIDASLEPLLDIVQSILKARSF